VREFTTRLRQDAWIRNAVFYSFNADGMRMDPCRRRWEGSALSVLLLLASCHAVKEPVSSIDIADLEKAHQLISGFYQLEDKSWRWTAREFSVALKPPEGGEKRGATLRLDLYIPDSQIELLGPMTLAASTGRYALDAQTFSKGGTYSYARKIPADALATSLLPVNFCFDKSLAPLSADGRELTAIVSKIELQAE
jgi:hypothetical protein